MADPEQRRATEDALRARERLGRRGIAFFVGAAAAIVAIVVVIVVVWAA